MAGTTQSLQEAWRRRGIWNNQLRLFCSVLVRIWRVLATRLMSLPPTKNGLNWWSDGRIASHCNLYNHRIDARGLQWVDR